MKYSELYRKLENDGWYIKRTGKHFLYAHPTKPGIIPLGKHKTQEVAPGTLKAILKQASLE